MSLVMVELANGNFVSAGPDSVVVSIDCDALSINGYELLKYEEKESLIEPKVELPKLAAVLAGLICERSRDLDLSGMILRSDWLPTFIPRKYGFVT